MITPATAELKILVSPVRSRLCPLTYDDGKDGRYGIGYGIEAVGMGRKATAWWWEERNGWYTTIGGKRRLLAKGKGAKKEAEKRLHRLLAADEPARPVDGGRTLEWIAYRFLDAVERDKAPLTLEYYRRHLRPLCDRLVATSWRTDVTDSPSRSAAS